MASRRNGKASRVFAANRRRAAFAALAVAAALAAAAWWAGGVRPVAAPASDGAAYLIEGRVLDVADGDTVAIQAGGERLRIRLASIDAPEVGGRDRPGQPHADASRRHLADMVAGRTVAARCYERDRYGRNICDLVLDGGTTANRRQVEAGMAWANMEGRGKFMRDPQIPGLERQAREAGRGLWAPSGSEPVRPWAWRYECWERRRC